MNKATTELIVMNCFYLFILWFRLKYWRINVTKTIQVKKMEATASINILYRLKLTANTFFLNPGTFTAPVT